MRHIWLASRGSSQKRSFWPTPPSSRRCAARASNRAGTVVDADGAVALTFGEVDEPVFPHSAVKALQSLPLVEGGAADALRLSEAEVALKPLA